MTMNGWVKIKPASRYASVSERTLRSWLKAGLRHSRLPTGTVLIQYSWIDEFLNKFEVEGGKGEEDVNRIVTEVCRDIQ